VTSNTTCACAAVKFVPTITTHRPRGTGDHRSARAVLLGLDVCPGGHAAAQRQGPRHPWQRVDTLRMAFSNKALMKQPCTGCKHRNLRDKSRSSGSHNAEGLTAQWCKSACTSAPIHITHQHVLCLAPVPWAPALTGQAESGRVT